MGRTLFGNPADKTGGGRRLSRAWLAPLLVLALWAADAKAQHVSNLGQSRDGSDLFDRYDVAQEFTTGTNAGGYILSSVTLRLTAAINGLRPPEVKVLGGAPAGTGSAEIATLTTRTTRLTEHSTVRVAFSAPPDVRLDRSTKYWVVVEHNGRNPGYVSIAFTLSDAEDSGSAAGWSIADTGLWRAANSPDAFEERIRPVSYMIRVDTVARAGTGGPPVAAASSVRTRPDTAYTFTVDDFRFTDPDGDALASVKIETLPAADKGMLTLDGNAVAAQDVVARSDIEAGNLRYAPPAGAAGEDFARFTFKVNDGTADSADAYAYTMTASGGANCLT